MKASLAANLNLSYNNMSDLSKVFCRESSCLVCGDKAAALPHRMYNIHCSIGVFLDDGGHVELCL
jgi:hypothetical protein